jgi:LCP family protein required for cell wall assembly
MSDRPYRVYRGGGPVEPRDDEPVLNLPVAPSPEEEVVHAPPVGERRGPVILPPPGAPPEPPAPAQPFPAPPPPPTPPRRRRVRIRTVIAIGIPLILILAVGWIVLGYLAFRSSVEEANARLEAFKPAVEPVLTPQNGLLLNRSTNILVLGADARPGQVGGRSDTLQIIHTDPDKHLMSTLSIPRDLEVGIPGRAGRDRINAAYTFGGPALAVKTVQQFTGLPIHHVIVVDFRGIQELVDALGGIDIDAPRALKSTFEGRTWQFPKGVQHLDGARALAYARVRKNELDKTDSDVSRGQRGQLVIAAIRAKLASPSSVFRLRKVGATVADPLATDLTANEILQLGWVSWRAQRELQCNLGGDPFTENGAALLRPDGGQTARVLGEFLGKTAVQKVPAGQPFAPACHEVS